MPGITQSQETLRVDGWLGAKCHQKLGSNRNGGWRKGNNLDHTRIYGAQQECLEIPRIYTVPRPRENDVARQGGREPIKRGLCSRSVPRHGTPWSRYCTLFWHDTVHPHLPRLSEVWRPLRPPGTLTSENPTFRTILGQDREFDELANGRRGLRAVPT
jgi:hypothetical protein